MYKVEFLTINGELIMKSAVTAIPEVDEFVNIDEERFTVFRRQWAYTNPNSGREVFGVRKPIEPEIKIYLVERH
jgi:hypothetical protein